MDTWIRVPIRVHLKYFKQNGARWYDLISELFKILFKPGYRKFWEKYGYWEDYDN